MLPTMAEFQRQAHNDLHRQIAQCAAMHKLSHSTMQCVMTLQKKQSLIPPAKYAAVHESRTAEDRRTAAELTARLTKLRNEHKDSAAHVASEVSQPAAQVENQAEAETAEHKKERRPWPVKVCRHTSVLYRHCITTNFAAALLLGYKCSMGAGICNR